MAASATAAAGSPGLGDRSTPWIVAVLSTVFFTVVCTPVLPYARQHDFLSFYTGGSIVRSGHAGALYDLRYQTAVEKATVPGLEYIAPYIRPPHYALLLAQLSRLPLTAAFALWAGAQIAALFAIWWWAYRRFGPESLVFCSLFVPTAYGIAHGQDCIWIAAALLSAWVLLERGRDGLSGATAALALVKFHLVLLVIPVLIVRRRWRMLGGYSAVAAVQAAISLVLIGPEGVRAYVRLLFAKDLETLSPSPERMINVSAFLINLNIDTVASRVMLSGIVIAAVVFVAWRAKTDWIWFWSAILGSVLIAPHAYEYDAAMLLPPMLMCIFLEANRAIRLTAATAVLPVVYLCPLLNRPWSIGPSLALMAWAAALIGRGLARRPRCNSTALTSGCDQPCHLGASRPNVAIAIVSARTDVTQS